MHMRVHVHAAIWVGDRLVVHSRSQGDRRHLSLPGGRVREREGVLDALTRELGEEIGLEVSVGDLLLAAEVRGVSRQGLVLVFAAEAAEIASSAALALISPRDPAAAEVLPPVLDALLDRRGDGAAAAWRGNVYDPSRG